MVSGVSVGLPVEPLGVRLPQHRVGRGVVVDHVDHALHALCVDGVDERLEILECSVLGVDRAVVAVGIGASERSFACLLADGVDGYEPDRVGAERADARQVVDERAECALRRMVAHEDRVDDGLLEALVDGVRHGCSFLASHPIVTQPKPMPATDRRSEYDRLPDMRNRSPSNADAVFDSTRVNRALFFRNRFQ